MPKASPPLYWPLLHTGGCRTSSQQFTDAKSRLIKLWLGKEKIFNESSSWTLCPADWTPREDGSAIQGGKMNTSSCHQRPPCPCRGTVWLLRTGAQAQRPQRGWQRAHSASLCWVKVCASISAGFACPPPSIPTSCPCPQHGLGLPGTK